MPTVENNHSPFDKEQLYNEGLIYQEKGEYVYVYFGTQAQMRALKNSDGENVIEEPYEYLSGIRVTRLDEVQLGVGRFKVLRYSHKSFRFSTHIRWFRMIQGWSTGFRSTGFNRIGMLSCSRGKLRGCITR